jgi:hypothetical protein
VDDATGKLAYRDPLPAGADPLEERVYEAALVDIRSARQAAAPEVAKIRERLEDEGLELPAGQARVARWLPALLLLSLAAFGLVKVAVGLSRHKLIAEDFRGWSTWPRCWGGPGRSSCPLTRVVAERDVLLPRTISSSMLGGERRGFRRLLRLDRRMTLS